MTNYEWIRSLNSDELAIAICSDGTCGFCDKRVNEFGGCDAECYVNIREWMKKEHEEEHEMTNDELMKAKKLAAVSINYFTHGKTSLKPENMYIVWFCRALQNWKALVSTDDLVLDDIGNYVEVTRNGDRRETHCNIYMMQRNVCFKDAPEEE